jgi:hypothetical protein
MAEHTERVEVLIRPLDNRLSDRMHYQSRNPAGILVQFEELRCTEKKRATVTSFQYGILRFHSLLFSKMNL